MATFQLKAKIALLAASALVGGWTVCLGPPDASAEDALEGVGAPGESPTAIDFADPNAALEAPFGVQVHESTPTRFSQTGPAGEPSLAPQEGYEFELTANGGAVGVPLDMSIAQRGNLSADSGGDLSRQGSGSELRVGQGLSQRRDSSSSASDSPTWYVFAASDDEALTWNPGASNAFGGSGSRLSLEDRVEIGDMQAGVTYEHQGVQASLAYVQRDVTAYVGVQSISRSENFAGVTLTMKH
jgi:hypothetical protein